MSEINNNLARLLKDQAETNPDQVLYLYNGAQYEAKTVWDRTLRLGAALKSLGVERGTRIILMLPNTPEFVIAYYAILSAGGVVIPINTMLREREIHYLMEDSEALAIIAPAENSQDVLAASQSLVTMKNLLLLGENLPAGALNLEQLINDNDPAGDLIEVEADETACILYTAGTTGRPKGAELTHHALSNIARTSVNLLQIRPRDRLLGVLPFFHTFGQSLIMNAALVAGAAVAPVPEFNPEVVMKLVQEEHISIFLANPSMYNLILADPDLIQIDFSSVRFCISGGAALQPEVMQAFEIAYQTTMLEGYGLCETSGFATFNHMRREHRPGSIGTPIDGVEVKIVDADGSSAVPGEVGEIAVNSEYLLKGYLNRPEATRAVLRDGWFFTGDLARREEDGYIYIVDRKTDMIMKGGFSVYPVEIENLLLSHPDIAEAAVIGISDPMQGEEIKTCIVLRAESTLTTDDLSKYCRERMARYKCPKYIQFYDQLPKSPAGKVLKKKLREMHLANQSNHTV
ncbi:MAG: AMP-binding protein [bacterium]|nr:AMP-binding protein [bacterium]